MQPPLHGFVRPVDKWTDEAGMEASVDKASLRVQAPRHLAGYRGEVLQVGMKEHPYHNGHGLILYWQEAGVCSRHRAESAPRETELISGDVDSHWLVTRIRDRSCALTGAAGQVDADLSVTGAERLLEEGQLLPVRVEGGKGLVIPVGMPVIAGRTGNHADTVPRPKLARS